VLKTSTSRGALEPQRRHGKQRVADLLEAGAAVIAERGYEAATMTEVAARAGAPIGSLYRFFPNKQVLGEALLHRYADLIAAAFERISDDPSELPLEGFVDALLAVFVGLHGESQTIVALLDAHSADWSAQRAELHATCRERIVRKLQARAPHLSSEAAAPIAVVVMQNMKSMKSIATMIDGGDAAAVAELREMTRLYLASKLKQ